MGHDFCVIDVETTGLQSHGYHHRVVEIAAVRVSANKTIIGEFESVVNPERDVGPEHIHGISARMAKNAPRFEEILGDFWSFANGAIPAAFNMPFDRGFIEEEYGRAGYSDVSWNGICLMQGARRSGYSGKLGVVAQDLGVSLNSAHRALNDARAATGILLSLWDTLITGVDLDDYVHLDPRCEDVADQYLMCERETAASGAIPTLANLLDSVPSKRSSGTGSLKEYSQHVQRVVEDRVIDESEIRVLSEFISNKCLSKGDVEQAHQFVLQGHCEMAWLDGEVTPAELQDLELLTEILGVDRSVLDQVIDLTHGQGASTVYRDFASAIHECSGVAVCFTGDSNCMMKGERLSRSASKSLAESLGMEVKSGVSKKLDVLVVSDPHTVSVKAKKARELGVRIMVERDFWASVGIAVD